MCRVRLGLFFGGGGSFTFACVKMDSGWAVQYTVCCISGPLCLQSSIFLFVKKAVDFFGLFSWLGGGVRGSVFRFAWLVILHLQTPSEKKPNSTDEEIEIVCCNV